MKMSNVKNWLQNKGKNITVTNFSIYWKVEDMENIPLKLQNKSCTFAKCKMNFEILALHDNELVQKNNWMQLIKIVLIYYLQKLSYLLYLFKGKKKTVLHSGILMKYLEGLTQDIKSFLPSKTTPAKL